jgi:hypothetical protein
MKVRRSWAPGFLIVPLLTGCGSHHSDASHSPSGSPSPTPVTACCPAPRDAHVSGVLVGVGGPSSADVQHWAGIIHVHGRVFSTVPTDGRGHFSMRLPAGSYRFTATSPSYDGGRVACRATHAVRLLSHDTSHVRVLCQLK